MEITARMVMALREKTGLPMMECKHALMEADGDEAKAVDLLRQKGLGQATKRAARETSEGRVACYYDAGQGRAGIVQLQCETAPVASTDDFISLARHIARHAALIDDPTPESVLAQPFQDGPAATLQDHMTDVVNRIRENIRIARVGSLTGVLGQYVHHNGKVGVLVEFSGACPDSLRADICMHVAAMRPPYLRREDIDAATVEHEREIARQQVQGKPPQIVDKIVAGKLNKWFAEVVLLEQPFVKDDKQSVGQVLAAAAPGLTVRRALRFEVGLSA
jgi:elongation factor Ts